MTRGKTDILPPGELYNDSGGSKLLSGNNLVIPFNLDIISWRLIACTTRREVEQNVEVG